MLQEVVNGPLVKTDNSAQDLRDILLSKVVFNTSINPEEPTVSDHAGVFVRLGLP